jgi:hypothetical protein
VKRTAATDRGESLSSRQAAVPMPQPRRGQLIVSSVLLALWLLFLAVMALTA